MRKLMLAVAIVAVSLGTLRGSILTFRWYINRHQVHFREVVHRGMTAAEIRRAVGEPHRRVTRGTILPQMSDAPPLVVPGDGWVYQYTVLMTDRFVVIMEGGTCSEIIWDAQIGSRESF